VIVVSKVPIDVSFKSGRGDNRTNMDVGEMCATSCVWCQAWKVLAKCREVGRDIRRAFERKQVRVCIPWENLGVGIGFPDFGEDFC
jgi:hypothetical protein